MIIRDDDTGCSLPSHRTIHAPVLRPVSSSRHLPYHLIRITLSLSSHHLIIIRISLIHLLRAYQPLPPPPRDRLPTDRPAGCVSEAPLSQSHPHVRHAAHKQAVLLLRGDTAYTHGRVLLPRAGIMNHRYDTTRYNTIQHK